MLKLMAVDKFCIAHSYRKLKLLTQKALKHRCAGKSLKVVVKERRHEPWKNIGYDRISSTRFSLSLARIIHLVIGVAHELVVLIETNEFPGCSLLKPRGSRNSIG